MSTTEVTEILLNTTQSSANTAVLPTGALLPTVATRSLAGPE